MLVHNPPFQGGIVQYCILLENSMKDYIDYDLIGFKRLYPQFLYKGKLPEINKSKINFLKNSNNIITWYNPFTWIKAYLKLKNNDIIHLHWFSPLLAPLQYIILILNKIFSKKKVVLTCHNIEPHESTFIDKILIKSVFSKIDHFIVHAFQSKKRLMENYNIKSSNISVIHHGTFDFFTKFDKKSKEELRKEFNFKNDEKIILFFAYIREYKGLRFLLRSMPKILEKEPKAKLLIAGELWQDWKTYQDIIDKLQIKDYIKVFPNYIEDQDVYKFFKVADIVVLPYYNSEQTISGPLLISLAFNKPTIVSDVGGISETITDEKNALLSKPGNVNVLSLLTIKLLNDKNLQKKLALGAKKTSNHLNWSLVAKKTNEVYKKLKNDA